MKPKIEKSESIYEGFCDIRKDTLKNHKGDIGTYMVISAKAHAVCVLAQDDAGRFLINKEYRHPIGRYLFTCPGGRIEPNEEPEKAAARELLEETGYTSSNFKLLGSFFPLSALCDQKVFLFAAYSIKKTQDPKLESFEFIQPTLLSKESLYQELKDGAEIDSALAAALLYSSIL